ncbi:MAG: nuclear transport factor 2 family protein [Rhizomicrobium sp.]
MTGKRTVDANVELAKKFFDAVERGDVNALKEFYSPDAKIWHNTDELQQTPAENVQTLEGFVTRIRDRRYGDRRVHAFPGGFVHQHTLSGVRSKDGVAVRLTACIVCLVENGRITRLDEYFDSAAVARFRA